MTCRKRAVVCYNNHTKHVVTIVELNAIVSGTSDVTYAGHWVWMVKMFDILPKQKYNINEYMHETDYYYIKPLKPRGNYSFQGFNIKKLYILPTESIYVFCRDLRKNRGYYPILQSMADFYIGERMCLLRGRKWNF